MSYEDIYEKYGVDVVYTYEGNPSMRIIDSYKVKKNADIYHILGCIHETEEYEKLVESGYTRTIKSEFQEWKGHNTLYSLGIARERTRSVDIDQNESWLRKFGYAILSVF